MSSALVNPLFFPEEWNVIRVIGNPGTVSPGICVLSGWDRKHGVDVKKGKGSKGATITFTDFPPVEGEIEFFLWDNGSLGTGHNHFYEWSLFLPLLKIDPTKKSPQAINIFHPALDDLGISSVLCVEIGPLMRGAGLMYSSKCKFLEYTPQPKGSAVGTAKGTKKLTPTQAAANSAQAAGDAATNALREALSAPSAQDQEMSKLWQDLNSQGKDAAS